MAKQWHQLERLDHKALKKLQAEREKAAKQAAQAEERRKHMLVGFIIMLVLAGFAVVFFIVNSRIKERAMQEERERLLYSSVTEFSGTVEFRQMGPWEPLTTNLKFKEDYNFRTLDESYLTVQMQLENQVKLYANTEVLVTPPILEAKECKVAKELVELVNGELTSAISLDGRDLMHIKVSTMDVVGQSGLFKVIYDREKDKGEVVVKNGIVEVTSAETSGKPTRISGFYKVTFENGELSAPTQASVIQYDWR